LSGWFSKTRFWFSARKHFDFCGKFPAFFARKIIFSVTSLSEKQNHIPHSDKICFPPTQFAQANPCCFLKRPFGFPTENQRSILKTSIITAENMSHVCFFIAITPFLQ